MIERPRFDINIKKTVVRGLTVVAIGAAGTTGVMAMTDKANADNHSPISPIAEVVPMPKTIDMQPGIDYDVSKLTNPTPNKIEPSIEQAKNERDFNPAAFLLGGLLGIGIYMPFETLVRRHLHKRPKGKEKDNQPTNEHVMDHHTYYTPEHLLRSDSNKDRVLSFNWLHRLKLLSTGAGISAAVGAAASYGSHLMPEALPFSQLSVGTAMSLGLGTLATLYSSFFRYEIGHFTTHDLGQRRSHINAVLGKSLEKHTGLESVKIAYPTLADLDTLVEKAVKGRERIFSSKKALALLNEFVQQVQQNQKDPAIPKFNMEDAQAIILKVAKQVANQESLAYSQGYSKWNDKGDRFLSYIAHRAPITSAFQRIIARNHSGHHLDSKSNFSIAFPWFDNLTHTKRPSSRKDITGDKRSWVDVEGYNAGRYAVSAMPSPVDNPNEFRRPKTLQSQTT